MGEVFAGRYELVDPIGRGGMGAVWRAWDQRRRRYVAAKVLQQGDAHTLLRFVREQALRIDHPNVLAPASWAADDDKVLFTMDLVGGGSLAHLIGDYGPLPPRFVCTLLDQLLAGLAAVHAEGVVHRDIKPANILLEATGTGRPHLRLSDFGISMRKGEPRLTETDCVVGTPGYFAPEQLLGAEPDFPADLFAVGLVALYLLQGARPDSRALVEHFRAHGTPDAPEGVPAPLWDVVANLLQPDPQSRFKTATGVRRALAEAVELLPADPPEAADVEVFDQLGPLPPGFGPQGPERAPDPRSAAGAATAAAAAAAGTPAAPSPQGGVPTAGAGAGEPTRTDPRAAGAAPAGAPAPAAAPAPARGAVPAQAPVQAPAGAPAYQDSSATGSFHLAPPVHAVPQPAPPAPEPASGAGAAPLPAPAARGRVAPPSKAAAAALLAAALLCFAVGVWALAQT
ncbi:serine/threonine-protein kinase [Streptomyces toxytricini]|uniref:non-specific serine/threonine protein kinase n=1 Tax=Streptomyces toxytricini TaxID=67369 RepID=A0ABW8EHU2_STRT5